MTTDNGSLARYDEARSALARCAKVDEAKVIRDKAEALRAYARQANDSEMETWAAEIKVRAQRRIGEISAALEKAHKAGKGNGTLQRPRSGLCKTEALQAAGLTKQTAHRCEQLAAVPEAVFEEIVTVAKSEGKPVSAKELVAGARRTLPRHERKKETILPDKEIDRFEAILEKRRDLWDASVRLVMKQYFTRIARQL